QKAQQTREIKTGVSAKNPSHLHKGEKQGRDSDCLDRTPTQCVHEKTAQTRASIRNAVAKRGNHSLLETQGWLGAFHSCLQNSVCELLLLVQRTAFGTFHQMRVQFFAFGFAQLAVQVGREKLVNIFVNRDHSVQEKTSVVV